MTRSILMRLLAFTYFGLIALALLLLSSQPYGREALAQHPQPPGTQPPAQQEQTDSNNKLGRLQTNAASMPVGVDDAISSLTKTVTKQFNCTQSTIGVVAVTVNITTTHVRWNPGLAAAAIVRLAWAGGGISARRGELVQAGCRGRESCPKWHYGKPHCAKNNS